MIALTDRAAGALAALKKAAPNLPLRSGWDGDDWYLFAYDLRHVRATELSVRLFGGVRT